MEIELEQIARSLHSLSLDMDFADAEEYVEKEIATITNELQVLKNNNCDVTLRMLEAIAKAYEG